MKLIVGLGNPGKKYNHTRHNVGFIILDNILGKVKWQEKFSSLCYETIIDGEKVIYLKPQTYMNSSGEAVRKVYDFYNLNSEDILIIQDDLDMEFAKIKIKKSSSSGGHNGIKSIINNLHSENFYHLKIGIKNNYKEDPIDFVLSKFSRKELKILADNTEKFINIVDLFIKNDILGAMNKYN